MEPACPGGASQVDCLYTMLCVSWFSRIPSPRFSAEPVGHGAGVGAGRGLGYPCPGRGSGEAARRMQTGDIKRLIESGIEESEAIVTGDGSHFDAIVVSDVFAGKSMLEEQRMVYAILGDQIASGTIHALSIKAYTREEWQRAQKLGVTGA